MNLETVSEYDLIGQEITVTQSKNKEITGIKGRVIMETKNTITLDTENGKKNIPNGSIKHFHGLMRELWFWELVY